MESFSEVALAAALTVAIGVAYGFFLFSDTFLRRLLMYLFRRIAGILPADTSLADALRHADLKDATQETLDARAERLSSALAEAVRLIQEIEGEIARGKEAATELERQIQTNTQLASLTESQARAVSTLVGATMDQGHERSRKEAILFNVASFVIGSLVSVGITLWLG